MKTDCGMLIKQISDHIAKDANNALRSDDLTLSQLRCMEYMYHRVNDKIPLKDIEAHFQIAQSTVAGIMSRLDKKGLIQMEVSESNARAKNVCLTDKGISVFQRAEQRKDKTEDVLLMPLSQAERRQFYELLKKVNDGLKNV